MQDSLEDYLRISKNFKEDIPPIKKDVKTTALKKKEYDVRALKIVEFSIEGKLRPEVFTKCLPYISRSHYQDIVEERAVTKLCGYSLCGKRIPEMPKKQYFISTKHNKVYDITDRRNYCSNFCYKASLHIKNQIDENPLWLRKLDDIPEYQLLDLGAGGLPGEEIDQGIAKPTVGPKFASVNAFAEISLQDMVENERGGNISKKRPTKKSAKSHVLTMQTISENGELVQEEEDSDKKIEKNRNEKEIERKSIENKEINQSFEEMNPVERNNEIIDDKCEEKVDIIEERVEQEKSGISNSEENSNVNNSISSIIKNDICMETIQENEVKMNDALSSQSSKENSIDNMQKTKKNKKKNSKVRKTEIESLIHKLLREWLTLESYIFLFGEQKIKEILDEKKLGDCFEKLNVAELRRDQQAKYLEICRKLQLKEMADEKFDRVLLGNKTLKPVPDYHQLKEESKDLNLKVKSFLSGELFERRDQNFPSEVNTSNSDENVEPSPVLPLADVNSQNAFRRKIFLTSINKSMLQLLQILQMSSYNVILSDLQFLVKTFKLKANNIIFKPHVWNYIALVLIHILSLKDDIIKDRLSKISAEDKIENFLCSSYKDEFFSNILSKICNIEEFLQEYICSS